MRGRLDLLAVEITQGSRHADAIAGLQQHAGDEAARGRLAVGPGDADQFQLEAGISGQGLANAAIGMVYVGHDPAGHAQARAPCRSATFAKDRRCPAPDCLGDELVAVVAIAGQGGKQIARPHAARVGRAAQGANVVGADEFGFRQQRSQTKQSIGDRYRFAQPKASMPQGKTTDVRSSGCTAEPSSSPAGPMILRAGLSHFPGLCQGEFRALSSMRPITTLARNASQGSGRLSAWPARIIVDMETSRAGYTPSGQKRAVGVPALAGLFPKWLPKGGAPTAHFPPASLQGSQPPMSDSPLQSCERVWIHARLATMDAALPAPYGTLEDHAIGVRSGRIAAIEPMAAVPLDRLAGTAIDAGGARITPGLSIATRTWCMAAIAPGDRKAAMRRVLRGHRPPRRRHSCYRPCHAGP